MINEPSSAAVAYTLNKGDFTYLVLVVDIGGGTLDVALLELRKGSIFVKATCVIILLKFKNNLLFIFRVIIF